MIYNIFACLISIISLTDCAQVGVNVQVPDKDPTLQSLVYKVAVPEANEKIIDDFYWVPATTQFTAQRLKVQNQGKYYSTWNFSMVLRKSDCRKRNTPSDKLQRCRANESGSKKFCSVNLALFDNDYSTLESEVHCV